MDFADIPYTRSASLELRRLLEERRAVSLDSALTELTGQLRALNVKPNFSVSDGVVSLGKDKEDFSHLQSILEKMRPWKKGPFRICGLEIDAEWRSDIKWSRLHPYADDLEGKRVADIGCNNGYFMFRMAEQRPDFVVGFEPVVKHYVTFNWLRSISGLANLYFEMLGVEHIHLFPRGFDRIFCLGILYHHTDPVGLLRKMKVALDKGGVLFIDCQGVPGLEPNCLVPGGRYAGASGIWFLPTLKALQNWVRRAGFSRCEVLFSGPLAVMEQRSTQWAPIKSLPDFLLSSDLTRTIEGYPAPHRFYLKVRH